MKNIKQILFFIGLAFFSTSCEKILEPEPQGEISLDALFSSEENAITAINGVYNPLPPIYGNLLTTAVLASDDCWTWRNSPEPDIYIVEQSYGVSIDLWTLYYNGATRANTVLDGITDVPSWSSDEMPLLIEGQAKFMRAFYYFNLVRFYGGVPLLTKSIESVEDAKLPRASVVEIYDQIKADLNDAINLLPASYAGGNGMEMGRPTQYAAQILLAYVYLEIEEWAAAANAAEAIIGNGTLLDYADYFNGTNENGAGTLFEVQYTGPGLGTSAPQNASFAPPEFNGSALNLPTNDDLNGTGGGPSSGNGIVQAYEDGDLRRDVSLAAYDIPNFIDPSQPDGTLFYVNKYFNPDVVINENDWNVPIYRYADALLVAAEALNEQSYVPDGSAFTYLNEIRTKAGLDALTSADLTGQASFRAAVRQERRLEFAFEYKRFFDLNRWGILESTISVQLEFLGLTFPSSKTSAHPITGKDYYLYPIPDVEFLNNPNLGEQNPGYN
ncbi:MAG: RagB/SusD family nutrient uptake outer membrane protein [Flavobacteriaceae bacterium]